MKLYILIVVFLIGLSGVQAQRINVASYNIRNANRGDSIQGNGWNKRCPVICKLIRFHDFDIFGAQEVLHPQLNDMLNDLPEYSYIGVGRDDGITKGEYAPIFYKTERFDMLMSGNFWLSTETTYPNKGWDAALPRICSWGKFKDKESGFQFWFFNLHMDHIGVEARKHSADLVLERIKEMCGTEAVILTGDFNVNQNHDSYKILNTSGILEDSFLKAKINYATNGTFNNFKPNLKTESRIDHIFTSPLFTVERYGVLTDTYWSEIEDGAVVNSQNFPKEVSLKEFEARMPSDHFPVKVVLVYN